MIPHLLDVNLIGPCFYLQTLIAKQSHFAYSTPRKTSVFQHRRFSLDKPFGLGDGDDYEIEAPGAPLQKRYRYRNEDDSGVSVALFK